MAVGLQCFDANGRLTIDTSDNITFFYGFGYTGTSVGSLYDARINPETTFIMPYKTLNGEQNTSTIYDGEYYDIRSFATIFTIEAGKISWNWKRHGGNMDPDNNPVTVNWFIYGGIFK